MITIEIEDTNGNTMMVFEVDECNDTTDVLVGRTIGYSFADLDMDDIFETNNRKLRMQQIYEVVTGSKRSFNYFLSL